MGLFDKIFGNRKEREIKADSVFKTLTAYSPVFTSWRGAIYESERVRAAIDARARHISKMSVRILGSAKPTLQTRLKSAPNAFQTWSQFLYRTSTILDVHNTCYIVPVIDKYDNTTGIYTVLPSRCEIVQYKDEPYLRYTFANGQTAAIELSRCGILTKHQYKDDFIGERNCLEETMQLIDIQRQAIKEGVKSAATYRFMAQLSSFSKAEDLAKERKRFSEENFSADAGAGGMLLFPNTYQNIKQIDSKPFVINAAQMQIINKNIDEYFGVNDAILSNSATADQLDAFYNGALEPFAIQLSEVLTKMLFTLNEQAYGASVHVASDRLQYMSVQSKISLIQTLGDRGMLSINEARALLNYSPIEGGDDMIPIRGEYANSVDKLEGDNNEN